jgi:hypothetical protein
LKIEDPCTLKKEVLRRSNSFFLLCLSVWLCWVQKGLKGPLKFDIDSDVGEVPIIEYLLAFALEPCAIHELTLLLLPFTHFSPFLSPSTTPHECARVCMYVLQRHTHPHPRKERERKKKKGGGRERVPCIMPKSLCLTNSFPLEFGGRRLRSNLLQRDAGRRCCMP